MLFFVFFQQKAGPDIKKESYALSRFYVIYAEYTRIPLYSAPPPLKERR